MLSVHPVALCIVLFFKISSVLFIIDKIGDVIVETYSNINVVPTLYVESTYMCCLLHLAEKRTISILLYDLAVALSM